MKLHAVAKFFDNENVYDGYTDAAICKGQVKNFNDASSTGATLRRRVLSVAPAYSLPSRQVVRLGADRWVSGIGLVDTFQGQGIRKTYNLRIATSLFQILTPGQVLVAPGTPQSAYAYEEYFKDIVAPKEDSEYDTFWNVFFSPDEAVTQGLYLRSGSRCLRVRQAYRTAEDLTIAQSDELDNGWSQTAVFDASVYDPLTDTFSGGTTTVAAIQLDISKFYRWRNQAEANSQPGDRVILVPSSVTPKQGAVLTLSSTKWRVMSYQTELDSWALHVRPV